MAEPLKAKQWTPLTDEERAVLHAEAEARGLTPGLLARVLLLDALDRVGSPRIERRIAEEKEQARQRSRDGARAAALARWSRDAGEGQA